MGDNKRNIPHDVSPPGPGPEQRSGTGTHERNRVEAEQAQEDRHAAGVAGQKESGDKPQDGRKGR